jgi:N-acetylmuramoyl-L-alanine amidase
VSLLVSKRPTSPAAIAIVAATLALLAAGSAALWARAARAGTDAAQRLVPGDLRPRGAVRTIVIDPGHGGDDAGTRGTAGTLEKDLVLQVAKQLEAAIESRLDIRVLLTRDQDVSLSPDARARFANSNRADLFLSLHANASVRPDLGGIEVLVVGRDDYKERARSLNANPQPLPVVGGGVRAIDPVPADIAQLPHTDRSAVLGATLVKRFTEKGLPGHAPFTATAPLRTLIGVNMPAALIELGFLSNAESETALAGPVVQAALVDAIVLAIGDVRFGFPASGPRR